MTCSLNVRKFGMKIFAVWSKKVLFFGQKSCYKQDSQEERFVSFPLSGKRLSRLLNICQVWGDCLSLHKKWIILTAPWEQNSKPARMCSCIRQNFAKTFCVRDLLGSVVRSRKGADTIRGQPQDDPCSGVTSQLSSPLPSPAWTPGGAQQFLQTAWEILWHPRLFWAKGETCNMKLYTCSPEKLKKINYRIFYYYCYCYFSCTSLFTLRKSLESWHLWTSPGVILLLAAPAEGGCSFREKPGSPLGSVFLIEGVSEWRGHLSCYKCREVKTE